MRASVIVVSYNSRPYLDACLASAAAQLGPDDELIVVDNSSSDGSAELVRDGHPRARLVVGPNDGYAGGNNRGAAAATGDALVFLNPDTMLEPGAIAALLAPLARPGVGLAAARVVHMARPDLVNAAGNTLHLAGMAFCRGAGAPRERWADPGEVDAVSGAAFAIRRALFAELGGFDDRLFMYLEDTELSLRARLAGWRVAYAPAATVRHDYRPSYSPAKAFYLERNRALMLLTHLDGEALLRLAPALLLAEAVSWGYNLLRGPRHWPAKPRAYAWLWRHRRAVAARRRPHPRARALLAGSSARLDFGQLAPPVLARLAGAIFDPAFAAARLIAARRGEPRRGDAAA